MLGLLLFFDLIIATICYGIAAILLYQQEQKKTYHRLPAIKILAVIAVTLQGIFLLHCFLNNHGSTFFKPSDLVITLDTFLLTTWAFAALIVYTKFSEPLVNIGVFTLTFNAIALIAELVITGSQLLEHFTT